jgi:hypothetical protein
MRGEIAVDRLRPRKKHETLSEIKEMQKDGVWLKW